jgi:hypothetical protein
LNSSKVTFSRRIRNKISLAVPLIQSKPSKYGTRQALFARTGRTAPFRTGCLSSGFSFSVFGMGGFCGGIGLPGLLRSQAVANSARTNIPATGNGEADMAPSLHVQ